MAAYLRKKYFVKKAFQLKYTGIILLFILLTALIAIAATYYTVFPYLYGKLANVYPQSRLISVLTGANMRLLCVILLFSPVIIWMSMMLSHRIAGPWHRLETILNNLANGTIVEDIKLRKPDELKSLADALNKLMHRLKADKSRAISSLDILERNLISLNDELNKTAPDFRALKEMHRHLQDAFFELKSMINM